MERAKRRFASALDGLRALGTKNEINIEVEERLQPEHCCLATIVRHGFPDDARCLAYDPVQKLLAIGTGRGGVRILGDSGVDYLLQHPTENAVNKIVFCVNEGALITACANDMVHLWNFRQKQPEILNTLVMQKESVTALHLPYQGRWLMIGTEKGNVYFVSVSTFNLSTYVINWNKAIDIACRVHPGHIRQIASCPTDHSKIAIVFEKGVVAVWDLPSKTAERLPMDPPVKCLCWHYSGASLVTGNVDGSLSVYQMKKLNEVHQKSTPHGTGNCRPIQKVDWTHSTDQEQCLVFSGGMPTDDNLPVPAITVLKGQRQATVMELEHPLTTFITLNQMPYESLPQQPHAIAVLLKNSFMLIDLQNASYPTIDSPHALDLHEQPVTAVEYCSDCPSDLMGALTLVGCRQRRKDLSERKWPINGGIARDSATGHQELMITGHKDGSVRFWAASGEDLQILYRLKAASHFERLEDMEQLPIKDASHAVKCIQLCTESRQLVVAGHSGQVTLFRFVKQENVNTIAVVHVPLLAPPPTATTSTSGVLTAASSEDRQSGKEMRRQKKVLSRESRDSTATHSSDTSEECEERLLLPFKVRGAPVKRPAGYQPELSCLIPWKSTSTPDSITSTALNSAFGVLAIGTASGLVLVDTVQCALIYAWTAAELYGSEPTPAVQLSQMSMGWAGDASPLETSTSRPDEGEEAFERDEGGPPSSSRETEQEEHMAIGRPAGRSHSVKAGVGIMRRLTNKGHSIARSFSLHVKENGTQKKEEEQPPVHASGDASPRLGCNSNNSGSNLLHGGVGYSPSASSTSLERAGKQLSDFSGADSEGVSSVSFMHSYTKRGDKTPQPSLWVGTTSGACIALNLLLPVDRLVSTVVVAPSGTVIRFRGALLAEMWMDSSMCLIEAPAERFKDSGQGGSPEKCAVNRVLTKESLSPAYGATQEQPSADELSQIVVLVSEWEIRVVALPSFSQLFSHKCEQLPFIKARHSHIRGHPCLIGVNAAGGATVLSLPSLRILHSGQLFQTKSIELDDPMCQRIAISENGLGVYMASPSEMEKYTVCSELADQVAESMGELFVPTEVPDQTGAASGKDSGGGAGAFLKGIFSGGNGASPRGTGPADLDAILLDKPTGLPGSSGTSTGLAVMRSVGRTMPGPAGGPRMDRAQAGGISAGQAAMQALQNLNERSEKLSATVDATENLKNSAQNMASRSAKLAEKMEKKKWYNF